jgi:putative peptide zinc metalloprotease protein
MSVTYPKVRKDLVVSRQEASGQTAYIIKDPVTGRFFRFREEEQFIVEQLDGATPQDVVCKRVEDRFGVSCSSEIFSRFLKRLSDLGLIEREGPPVSQAPGRHRRVRGSVLYLRFMAFDPDRLFNRLIRKVGFFFTPHFVTFSAGIILFATGITILNWGEIWQDFQGLFRFQALFLAWLTMLSIVTAHEFAHGLACKKFGGQVHDIGFMLLYLQPAFYCNVSDAWLFPEKSRRLWVSFAGAYFELFLWAIATLLWRLTEPGTIIHFQALVVTAASGIATLFNLNPLIKLDGYYMLSDYVEIPNLRQRAFNHMGRQIRKFVGMADPETAPEATSREKRIYLVYGLLAWAYSFLLLGWIALRFGDFMVGKYQGTGFVVFTAVFLVAFRNQLRRIIAGFGNMTGSLMKKLPVILFLAVLMAVLFIGRAELKVSGEFTIFPVWNADIRAGVEGIIQEIYVDQGDRVVEGQPIVTLSDRDYSAEFKKVAAELHEKEAMLMKLKAGSREEEIEVVKREEERAQARLNFADKYYDRYKELLRRDLISRMQFEEAEEQKAVRQKELEETRAKLKVLLAGSRREDIDGARAEIRRLEVQQRYLGQQIGLVRLVSPVEGIVTTHDLKEKVGQHVKKGDLIAEVHELKTVKAEIVVPEKEIADVRVGQAVVLKARAYPNRSFEGKVTAIAPIVTKTEDKWQERTILVTTELSNASLLLKPEMTGNAKIFCGQRRIFDLLTRRLSRYIRVEFWSWW